MRLWIDGTHSLTHHYGPSIDRRGGNCMQVRSARHDADETHHATYDDGTTFELVYTVLLRQY
jgi:hypothetical protein